MQRFSTPPLLNNRNRWTKNYFRLYSIYVLKNRRNMLKSTFASTRYENIVQTGPQYYVTLVEHAVSIVAYIILNSRFVTYWIAVRRQRLGIPHSQLRKQLGYRSLYLVVAATQCYQGQQNLTIILHTVF